MNTGTAAIAQSAQGIGAIGEEASSDDGFLFPNTPNLIDFWGFLNNVVQIPADALPGTSPWPQYALTQAIGLVLNLPCTPQAITYTLAVYNAATHLLYGIAPDQPGSNFFTVARSKKGYSLVNPSTGIIAATSDESTSSTLASPEWAKGLTVGQLDFFRTPWGRAYLSYQQSYGPTIIALT